MNEKRKSKQSEVTRKMNEEERAVYIANLERVREKLIEKLAELKEEK